MVVETGDFGRRVQTPPETAPVRRMLGRELRRIAKRAPLPLRLMLRAFNPHAREDSHGVTETQRRFTAGALPQTPKASPLTSDKITGFYRIDRIF